MGSHYVGLSWKIISAPVMLTFSLLFNLVIRRRVNKTLVRMLMKFAQGDNSPGSRVHEVTPVPCDAFPNVTPLPSGDSSRIAEHANSKGTTSLPVIRELLYQLALGGFWQQSGEEDKLESVIESLVHSSYFAVEDIDGVIAEHIRWTSGMSSSVAPHLIDQTLAEWLATNRRLLAEAFAG